MHGLKARLAFLCLESEAFAERNRLRTGRLSTTCGRVVVPARQGGVARSYACRQTQRPRHARRCHTREKVHLRRRNGNPQCPGTSRLAGGFSDLG
jgi:hypothetical protein